MQLLDLLPLPVQPVGRLCAEVLGWVGRGGPAKECTRCCAQVCAERRVLGRRRLRCAFLSTARASHHRRNVAVAASRNVAVAASLDARRLPDAAAERSSGGLDLSAHTGAGGGALLVQMGVAAGVCTAKQRESRMQRGAESERHSRVVTELTSWSQYSQANVGRVQGTPRAELQQDACKQIQVPASLSRPLRFQAIARGRCCA